MLATLEREMSLRVIKSSVSCIVLCKFYTFHTGSFNDLSSLPIGNIGIITVTVQCCEILDSTFFYRAMHFSAKRGIEIAYCPSDRPSVCLCVTFRYRDHIGWNSSKIISRPNSVGPV